MTNKTVESVTSQSSERGIGFLFWGLIAVTVLNLVMILGALALFAP